MTDKPRNLDPATNAAIAHVLASVMAIADEDPLAIDRVAALFDKDAQTDHLVSGVLGILPSQLDAEQWNVWLSGGSTPPAPATLVDPDKGQPKSARGAQIPAARRDVEARKIVSDLEQKLEAAKSAAKDSATQLQAADNQLRAVVVYRMITEAGRLFAAPFAMGPMWTLVRAISGYLRPDAEYEDSLDMAASAALEIHKANRKATSAKIQELLDMYCGDVALEVILHRVLLSTLEAYHQPVVDEWANRNYVSQRLSAAARRPKRNAEDRHNSVRRGAPTSDRDEVLSGLDRTEPGAAAEDGKDRPG
jgi:hypothetical protein